MDNYFTDLALIDIKCKTEQKGRFTYLSWATAWSLLKMKYPAAQRKVYENELTKLNFFTDGKTGYVKVGIIVNEIEHIDFLPIMDNHNKSISIEKVTSTDINKSIQRSTAKAIAMHGLGLSLWVGEDIIKESLPDFEESTLISKEQVLTIEKLLFTCGGDKNKFYSAFEISTPQQMPISSYDRAIKILNKRIESMEEK